MTDGLHAHDRPADLVLARVHLRMGSLSLARAELETMAGRDLLDADGLLDLAEARWRTGDLAGAGEAANAALDGEDGPLVALVIAAEAAAARGRPTEARRLAGRALAVADGTIDAIFAGMPRASAWPPDASAPAPAPTTMFDPPHGTSAGARVGTDGGAEVQTAGAGTAGEPADDGASSRASDATSIGLWDAETTDAPDDAPMDDLEVATALSPDLAADAELAALEDASAEADLPYGDEELERGRAALEAGAIDAAAVHLALVLRLTPVLAPIVVELLADRPDAALALVRGDAYRLVGRESEALRAWAAVVGPSSAAGASSAPGPVAPDPVAPDPVAPATEPTNDTPEGDPA